MARLIYDVTFYNGTFEPVFGHKYGPLQITQPPDLPGVAEMKAVSPSGLRLTLTRTKASEDTPGDPCRKTDDCYIGAVLYPFPADLDAFKIRATFELPRWQDGIELPELGSRGHSPADYAWAMVVFARVGDARYVPVRWERTTVTLQSTRESGKLEARMNTPCGAPEGTPSYSFDNPYPRSPRPDPIPDDVRKGIFESTERVTIELLIDRKGEIARAGLEAVIPGNPPKPYRDHRWFVNPNIAGEMKGPIDSVGFAIANASGLADVSKVDPVTVSASVIIREFSVYKLDPLDLFIAWIERFLDRFVRRLLFP